MNGLKHIDVLKMFNDDPQTEAVIMVGEIGGSDEENAARWVKDNMKKPVVGFIAGVTAPPGKRMGHAGAIISGGKGTAQEKLAVMEECGIKVTQQSRRDGQAAEVGAQESDPPPRRAHDALRRSQGPVPPRLPRPPSRRATRMPIPASGCSCSPFPHDRGPPARDPGRSAGARALPALSWKRALWISRVATSSPRSSAA